MMKNACSKPSGINYGFDFCVFLPLNEPYELHSFTKPNKRNKHLVGESEKP